MDSPDDESLRDALRQLGFREEVLTSAVAAFGTVEVAQSWLEVLGPDTLRSDWVYDIAMSGSQPDTYAAWRAAGLDEHDALRLPRQLVAAGLGVDDLARWTAVGSVADLMTLLPQLKSQLTFDELLQLLNDWNVGVAVTAHAAGELIEVLNGGLSIEELRRLTAAGLRGHKVSEWFVTGIPSTDWSTWMAAGFDAPTAARFHKKGVAVADASGWLATGLSAADAVAFIGTGVPPAAAGDWVAAGASARDAREFTRKRVPMAVARRWLSAGFAARDALAFIAAGMSVARARTWTTAGLSTQDALAFISKDVQLGAARRCLGAGLSSSTALTFLDAGISLPTARRWTAAGFSADDALAFINIGVSPAVARKWTDADIEPADAVEYIGKTVPLDQATEFERRRVSPSQITRTDTGYEVELEHWQKDPVDQLPKVIEPGGFGLSLWSFTPWSDEPLENEVFIGWDGKHTIEWSVVSGAGLGMISSVYSGGIASWPNGKDVQLNYSCSEFGVKGGDELKGAAPTAEGPKGAKDPRKWIELAQRLVWLTEEFGESGGESSPEFADEYHRPTDDGWFEFDDMFRIYLDSAGADGTLPRFDDWLTAELDAGTYEIP